MKVTNIEILHNPVASMQYMAFVTYQSRSAGWFGSKSMQHVEAHSLAEVRQKAEALADHLRKDEWSVVEELV